MKCRLDKKDNPARHSSKVPVLSECALDRTAVRALYGSVEEAWVALQVAFAVEGSGI